MSRSLSHSTLLIVTLTILVAILLVANLFVGSVAIPVQEVFNVLTGQE